MKNQGQDDDFNRLMQVDESLHFYDNYLNQNNITFFNQKIIEPVKKSPI